MLPPITFMLENSPTVYFRLCQGVQNLKKFLTIVRWLRIKLKHINNKNFHIDKIFERLFLNCAPYFNKARDRSRTYKNFHSGQAWSIKHQ